MRFKVGERVKIVDPDNTLRTECEDTVGWNSAMRRTINRTGEVLDQYVVTPNLVRVAFTDVINVGVGSSRTSLTVSYYYPIKYVISIFKYKIPRSTW